MGSEMCIRDSNYSDALLTVPSDVTVHTSSPAVELLYALYFYLS